MRPKSIWSKGSVSPKNVREIVVEKVLVVVVEGKAEIHGGIYLYQSNGLRGENETEDAIHYLLIEARQVGELGGEVEDSERGERYSAPSLLPNCPSQRSDYSNQQTKTGETDSAK